MKLYFVRHGQTDANAKMVSGQTITELDEPLNENGIQQAEELAEQLKDVSFEVLVSSSLKRTRQTAGIVNKYHTLEISVDDAWQERRAGIAIDRNIWNDLFDFDKSIVVENGESLEAFFSRVYAAIDDLKGRHSDKTILVVSHGGVQHAVYAYANKLPLSGNMRISPMRNCEYRVYEL